MGVIRRALGLGKKEAAKVAAATETAAAKAAKAAEATETAAAKAAKAAEATAEATQKPGTIARIVNGTKDAANTTKFIANIGWQGLKLPVKMAKFGVKTAKYAAIGTGLTWGGKEVLEMLNENWDMFGGGQPPEILKALAAGAGLLFQKEKDGWKWAWDKVAKPTAANVEALARAWNKHEEQYYATHPNAPRPQQPETPTQSTAAADQQQTSAPAQQQQPAAAQTSATSEAAPIDPNDRSNASLEDKIKAAKEGEARFDENSDKLAPEVRDALKDTYRARMRAMRTQLKSGEVEVDVESGVDRIGNQKSKRNQQLLSGRSRAMRGILSEAAKEEGLEGQIKFASRTAPDPKTSALSNQQLRHAAASFVLPQAPTSP